MPEKSTDAKPLCRYTLEPTDSVTTFIITPLLEHDRIDSIDPYANVSRQETLVSCGVQRRSAVE